MSGGHIHEAKLEQTIKELEAKDTEIARLKAEVERLKGELANGFVNPQTGIRMPLRWSFDVAMNEVGQLKRKNASLRAKNERLKLELDSLNSISADIVEALKESKQSLAAAKQENERLREHPDSRIVRLEKDINALRVDLATAEQKVERLRGKVEKLRQTVELIEQARAKSATMYMFYDKVEKILKGVER